VKAVVERDEIINLLWDTLEQQTVIKTAERRIGKTTIAKKMLAEPRDGWCPFPQDLEQYHSAMDFAMSVYREVHKFLSKRGKATRRAKELLTSLGGTAVGGVIKLPEKSATPWKDVLKSAIADLMNERAADDERLVFLWDEMPYMLENIRTREGADAAMEVLDVLRALRQDNESLRMVITGSIGLHHVLGSLKKAKHANASVNDMLEIEVLPLKREDAVVLATKLIKGEELDCPDIAAAATTIADESDSFPFYIHHIVKALKIKGGSATPERIREIVLGQLVDEKDPWELDHYQDRIPIYYGEEDAPVVVAILDELSLREEPAALDTLLAELKNVRQFSDREKLLSLLKLLVQDHYLARDSEGAYEFRFPLIKRWWKLSRSL
jgi:hypothetical protein